MVHSVHLNAAGASFRSCNVQKNLSILERGPQFVGDHGGDGQRVSRPGPFRGGNQTDSFPCGHVALVTHPAGHLAPETVMVFVFYSSPPSPGGIRSHEEDFSVAAGLGDNKRNTAIGILIRRMHSQDSASRFGPFHGGVPVEARQIAPYFFVFTLRIRQHGKQGAAAFRRQDKGGWGRLGCPLRLGVEECNGHQVPQFRFQEFHLPALVAGEEDDAAGLVFYHAFEQGGLFFR